jgi:hypothetical protein
MNESPENNKKAAATDGGERARNQTARGGGLLPDRMETRNLPEASSTTLKRNGPKDMTQ